MKSTIQWMAAFVAVCSPSVLRAEFIDQIPGPFVLELYSPGGGAPSQSTALSQYDLGIVNPPQVRNFATIYDNFTFGSSGTVDSFSWVGAYSKNNVTGATFDIAFYSNAAGEPGLQLQQYSVGTANETAIAGHPGFFNYSTTATPFAITGGDQYWVSIVGRYDTGPNGDDLWGVAFSATGDDSSFQDFGDSVIQRFPDTVDYAFRISTVPEPTSLVYLCSLFGVACFRRRRRS